MPALSDAVASPAPAAPQAPAGPAGLPSPFADVVAGSVPAVSLAPIVGGRGDPTQEWVVGNFEALLGSGLEYAELPDAVSVFFNPKLTTAEDLKAADKAGKLAEIAPPAVEIGKPPAVPAPAAPAPAQTPALAAPPTPIPAPSSPSGALSGATATPSAPNAAKLAGIRARNAAPAKPNTPSGGPLGALSKRAV